MNDSSRQIVYLHINHQLRRRLQRVSRYPILMYYSGLTFGMNLLVVRTTKAAVDDDEEAQLKALQAELAM